MPKKMKLDLKGLKVKSFVTNLGDAEQQKINGGLATDNTFCTNCSDDCSAECTKIFACTYRIIASVCHPECVIL